MDLILVCRDALMDSVITNVGIALEERKKGREVALLFTGEALHALTRESFRWSPLFQDRSTRARILKNATAMGIEAGDRKDSRWADLSRLLELAAEKGVKLLACPLWTDILEAKDNLPRQLNRIDREAFFKALREAQIVGSF